MTRIIKTFRKEAESLKTVFDLTKNPLKLIDRLQKSNDVKTLNILGKRITYVGDVETLRRLLEQDDSIVAPGDQYDAMEPVIGSGMVRTSGPLHKTQRKLALRALSKRSVERTLPTIERVVNDWVRALPEKGTLPSLKNEMIKISGTIGSNLIFGQDGSGELNELLTEALPIFNSFTVMNALDPTAQMKKLPFRPTRDMERYRKKIDGLILPIIQARLDQTAGTPQDILDSLIIEMKEDDIHVTARDIRDQVLTFMLAATETTASVTTWALYHMAKSDRIADTGEERCPVVHGAYTGKNIDETGVIGNHIQESLRRYPPTYLLTRSIARDIEVNGREFKSGELVVFSLYGVQANDPTLQLPQNYCPGRVPTQGRKYHMAFGHGVRRCPGETLAYTEMVHAIKIITDGLSLTPTSLAPQPVARITLVPPDIEVYYQKRTS